MLNHTTTINVMPGRNYPNELVEADNNDDSQCHHPEDDMLRSMCLNPDLFKNWSTSITKAADMGMDSYRISKYSATKYDAILNEFEESESSLQFKKKHEIEVTTIRHDRGSFQCRPSMSEEKKEGSKRGGGPFSSSSHQASFGEKKQESACSVITVDDAYSEDMCTTDEDNQNNNIPNVNCILLHTKPGRSSLLSHPYIRMLLSLLMLSIVAFVIALALYLSHHDVHSNNTTDVSGKERIAGNYNRSTSTIVERLLPISGDTVFDSTTDQYKALQWILSNFNYNHNHSSPLPPLAMDDSLEETYIITVLHFATKVLPETNIFLHPTKSVCQWHGTHSDGVVCDSETNSIRSIILRNLNLTGTLPSELSHLSSLEIVRMENNNLHGTIPTEFGTFANVYNFDLSNNHFTGTIPSEMGKIGNKLSTTNGVHFSLKNNNFTGTIPKEISNIPAGYIDLSTNSLNGTLPSELQKVTDLKHLGVGNNQLTGIIPTEFGKLYQLESLYLEHNLLSGTIPTEFGQLSPTQFKYLRLDNNYLEGSVPSEMIHLSGLVSINMHNNYITGNLNQLFCNASSSTHNDDSSNVDNDHGDINNVLFQNLTTVRADTSCHQDDKNINYFANLDNEDTTAKVTCGCCCCFCVGRL